MRIAFLLCLLLVVLGTAGCITGSATVGDTPSTPPSASEPTTLAKASATPVSTTPPNTVTSLVQLDVVVKPREAAEIALSPRPLGANSYLPGRTVSIFVIARPGWKIKEWVGPVYGVLGEAARIDMDNSRSVAVDAWNMTMAEINWII